MSDLISRQAAIDAIAYATFNVTISGKRGFQNYKEEFAKASVAIRDKYIEALKALPSCIPKPAKCIFNGPATIAIWEDRTKTVVKLMPGDTYDPEKAVAMCYIKKMLGTSEAMKARKKAMKAYEEQKAPEHDMDPEEKTILEKLTRMAEEIKRREQNIENRSV